MKSSSIDQLVRDVFKIFQEIERSTQKIKKATGLQCNVNCGQCCWSRHVEATVVEMLPCANYLLRSGEIENVRNQLEAGLAPGLCFLFKPDMQNQGNGFCSQYRYRPLMCRTFGYSAYKGKDGTLKPQVCRILKETQLMEIKRLTELCDAGKVIPAQSWFYQIANLEAIRGIRLLPINVALKECIDMIYSRKPRHYKLKRVC